MFFIGPFQQFFLNNYLFFKFINKCQRFLIEISTEAHLYFGIQTFIKKLHLGHYGLTHPYCPFKDLIQTSIESSYFFWCLKIYSKNCIRDNMVWHILSFQRSYINVDLMLIYFLVLKMCEKIESWTLGFDCYFLFQEFYQVFIKGLCFFRWGTHLYMSLFLSVHLSVHSLRTISQELHIIWS